MKKWMGLFLCLALILSMAGCGNGGSAVKNQPTGVSDVLKSGMEETDRKETENSSLPEENKETQEIHSSAAEETSLSEQSSAEPETEKNTAVKAEEDSDSIDVDLTALSSTMVYSEVYNMMSSPEDYIGKTVKMKGSFACYHDEATDNYYFACIIQDATACCAQGIEFVLTDDYKYPDDYPEIDDEICTVGTFDTYEEGEYTYCTLRNAKLLS